MVGCAPRRRSVVRRRVGMVQGDVRLEQRPIVLHFLVARHGCMPLIGSLLPRGRATAAEAHPLPRGGAAECVADGDELDIDCHDTLRLARGLEWEDMGARLTDAWLDVCVAVGSSTAVVLHRLSTQPSTIVELGRCLSTRFEIDEQSAIRDVRRLLRQLDDRAMLAARRSVRTRLLPTSLLADTVALLSLQPRRKVATRYPMSLGGVWAATVRQAAGPMAVLLVMAFGFGLMLVSQLPSNEMQGAVEAAGVLPLLGFVHVLLLLAHEGGHVLALVLTGCRTGLVARRGLRLGVVYPRGCSNHPRLVAGAGPLLAAFLSLPIAWVGMHVEAMPIAGLRVAAIVGVTHLFSLGPWTADGRTLWGRATLLVSTPADGLSKEEAA